MADVKISGLPASTVPLAGTEVLPIVQGGQTRQVSIANVTAGRAISATTIQSTVATGTAPLTVASTTEVANLRSANATSADTANQVKSNATSGVLQIAGPAAAATRVMTTPDANFTAARTDAGQTFTGTQTFSTPIAVGSGGTGLTTLTAGLVPYGNGTGAFSSGGLNFSGIRLQVAGATSSYNAYDLSGTGDLNPYTSGTGSLVAGSHSLWLGAYANVFYGVKIKSIFNYGVSNTTAMAFETSDGSSLVERMRVFASGGVSIGNTADPGAANLSVTGTVRTGGYTVATLPAAGVAGRRAYVTDATLPTYLGALVGGGAVVCPVFDNGAAWVSA